MPPQPLEFRVERLAQRMTELEQLPGRIDDLTSQISQLRTKMDAEFSAVRAEIAERATGVEMRVLHEDVINRLALLQEGQAPRSKPKPRPRKKS